jgi:hypothetical protein
MIQTIRLQLFVMDFKNNNVNHEFEHKRNV